MPSMSGRIIVSRLILNVSGAGLMLFVAGCAELGDAWQEAGRELEELLGTAPAVPTEEEQQPMLVPSTTARRATRRQP